jgi:hypothetical protein
MDIKFRTRLLPIILILSLLTTSCAKPKETVETNSGATASSGTSSTANTVETTSSVSTPAENPPPKETDQTSSASPAPVDNSNQPTASDSSYIFSDSQTQKLRGEDVMGLQTELLPFAMNEIFARRGYVFKDSMYVDYFSKKSWYKPNPDFNTKDLSETENYNVNLIKYFKDQYNTTQKPNTPQGKIYHSGDIVSYNLNGDGVDERIIYMSSKGELTINSNVVKLNLDSPAESFAIADLNKNDKFKEILICDYGPSDDYKTYYYAFDGSKVIEMGRTQGLFDYGITIDGSGKVTALTRGQILQTWFFRKTFQLTKEHKLEEVSQDLYSTDYDVFLKIPLKLYKDKGDGLPSLPIKEGQRVKIIGTDNKEWCLLKAADGTTGWIALDKFSIIRNNGLQAPEVFEGLSYAD